MHAMTTRVLVVGHADADGHIIAEQTRRNLALIPSFDVSVLVDPSRTQGHRVWTKLETLPELDQADIVFFTDLMFGPTEFAEESDSLVRFLSARPRKRFFLVDHHPVPNRRLQRADNLRVVYRPDVFDCTFGPRTGMMVVAALCENQGPYVADIKLPMHEVLALGMRRAAALGGVLPGEKLLALLRADAWDALRQIGEDDRASHRLPRGRRPANLPGSEALNSAETLAEKLMSAPVNQDMPRKSRDSGGEPMPYDVGDVKYVPGAGGRRNEPVANNDLEAIVTLLEVAALSLTDRPGATFTLDQLVAEARSIGGEGIDIEERDIHIVLEKQSFLEKAGGEVRLR
jgi:hypothetical protein